MADDVKLTESEILDLRVAEAGARSTSRRRVCHDWRSMCTIC